jgi:hypothetical protein
MTMQATIPSKAAPGKAAVLPAAGARRGARRSVSRTCCLAAAAGCAAIALVTTGLYSHEAMRRGDAVAEVGRLRATVAHLRDAAEVQEREADVALQAARQQAATSQDSATQDLKRELAAATAASDELSRTIEKLRGQLAAAGEELQTHDKAAAEQVQALTAAKRDLETQVDGLRTQVLQLAAAAQAAATAKKEEPENDAAVPVVKAAVETRWALGISYDTAQGFAALCFDRGSLREAAAGNGAYRKSTATRAAGASTYRFVHDGAHERVYSAALTVSLAADGPRDRLVENTKVAVLFLQTFAPAFRSPEEWLSGATRQLAAKDSGSRMVTLDTTYKITAYNDGRGTFTFKVESPREDLED